MLTALAALIGLAVGAGCAAALLLLRSGSRVHVAEREAETIRREAQIEARELAVKLRAEIETEVQDRRTEAAKVEERITQAEHELEPKDDRGRAPRAGSRRPRDARQAAAGRAQDDQGRRAHAARARRRADRRGGEAPPARALAGPDPPRARPERPPAGGGGADRVETARAGPDRRRAPAGRREPHGRDDRDRRRASRRTT